MRFTKLFWFGAVWLGLAAPAASAGPPEEDEATLKEAQLQTDTPALLEFFRKRVLPETDHDRVRALIKKLGADAFAVRAKATEDLIALGPGIAQLLREATRNSDYEVADRARTCLTVVEKTSTVPLVSAAVRLLGHRKPPEAARILLDFAPYADEEVREVLRGTLQQVALRDGKPDPALLTARDDKQPLRRALAVEALVRARAMETEAARKFLKDTDALVRLRTALALVDRGDRAAVPALIEVLPAVPQNQAWLAEDILSRLAGEQTPNVSLGEDESSRKNARDAWAKWYREQGAKVDLAKLKERAPFLGLTLVAYQDNQGVGRLLELSRDGKTRWEFSGLLYPTDFQVLGENRFLVAEMNGSRVTERNRKGEIVWQKAVQQPVAVQRLANGNTFVASPNGIYEFDAQGKQTFSHNRGRWDIMGARKHRNGEYILLTRMQLVRIDGKGKELGSFNIGRNYNYSSFEILPNGNLLLPLNRTNRVVEYTLDGKEQWSAAVTFPTSARRLPNGNVIVASMNYQRVIEVGRDGKQVSSTQITGTPWCAIRR
jgi:HEAT repeat protein